MNANRFRNHALIYMFAGFFIMYCGVYSHSLLPYLLLIGSVGVIIGIILYFRYGPVNPHLQTMECPRCGKETKLKGKYDACPHCQLTLRRTEHGAYEPYSKP